MTKLAGTELNNAWFYLGFYGTNSTTTVDTFGATFWSNWHNDRYFGNNLFQWSGLCLSKVEVLNGRYSFLLVLSPILREAPCTLQRRYAIPSPDDECHRRISSKIIQKWKLERQYLFEELFDIQTSTAPLLISLLCIGDKGLLQPLSLAQPMLWDRLRTLSKSIMQQTKNWATYFKKISSMRWKMSFLVSKCLNSRDVAFWFEVMVPVDWQFGVLLDLEKRTLDNEVFFSFLRSHTYATR